ncbi:MAG: HAMP domain-containing histidine kinase [Gemmatimonadetes bacterium]|nr:HAMP domain-containing histidine kinase [Gemmatimonadota bacterium]
MTAEQEAARQGAAHAGLVRALRMAAGAPDVEQALEAVVQEAVAASGACGGAVVEREGLRARALRGCADGELQPLLEPGGALVGAFARLEEWIDSHLQLRGGSGIRTLLAPMQIRGVGTGALVLQFPERALPVEEVQETARAFADAAALALEHDHLFEEARTARQGRDHFFTALNHEIRTPAMALMLSADMLRLEQARVPPRLQKVLDQAQNHLGTIIRVLDGALELGDTPAEAAGQTDVVQPRQFVRDLLLRVEPAANRKKLPISFYVHPSLPPLQTDAAKLSQILLQLFSNAVKYTTEGGIEVRVQRTVRSLGRHRREPVLEVHVRDSGRGIPAAELERIMEPFVQVDEGARSDSHSRGAGLGLALSRRLARSLGGELFIESRAGEGTTASLVLPYRH